MRYVNPDCVSLTFDSSNLPADAATFRDCKTKTLKCNLFNKLTIFRGTVNGGELFSFVCTGQDGQCGNTVKPDVIL